MESMFERLVSDFAYLREINSCNNNIHLNISLHIVCFSFDSCALLGNLNYREFPAYKMCFLIYIFRVKTDDIRQYRVFV